MYIAESRIGTSYSEMYHSETPHFETYYFGIIILRLLQVAELLALKALL